MTEWATIEVLAPDSMSMASVGDAPRDFAGLHRTIQRLLAKSPALYDGLSTARLIEALVEARDQAKAVDLTIATGSGPHRLLIRPILGPAGDVHAVRMWLASASTPVPPPRPAVGVIWDLETQTMQQPSGITQLSGLSAEEYAPRTSIAELFHRMSAFDRHTEVLDLLYDPKPGDKLQFDVTITPEQGRAAQWRITMRARDDQRTRGAWLLVEDITSDNVAAEWPTLERTGLREAHRRAGTHLAVLQLEHASISHWLTDPAPWIRWDYLFRPIDVFHPDDRERIMQLGGRLHAGDTVGVTVRTLNYSGGYTMTSLLLYPYPGYASTQLAIGQAVHLRDEVSLPESPEESVPRSTPIGYDDQLRHRLAGRRKRIAAY
ncbi:GAF domain-containing protein [Nocardia altamirensis]|uniref:GAF domain-containing protein n=1 Tax=Nocardia altamirensis TaxID=472158 RepID=UPI000ADD89EF|nr:GAF domain-containing protein [Nocardia altamirensis]